MYRPPSFRHSSSGVRSLAPCLRRHLMSFLLQLTWFPLLLLLCPQQSKSFSSAGSAQSDTAFGAVWPQSDTQMLPQMGDPQSTHLQTGLYLFPPMANDHPALKAFLSPSTHADSGYAASPSLSRGPDVGEVRTKFQQGVTTPYAYSSRESYFYHKPEAQPQETFTLTVGRQKENGLAPLETLPWLTQRSGADAKQDTQQPRSKPADPTRTLRKTQKTPNTVQRRTRAPHSIRRSETRERDRHDSVSGSTAGKSRPGTKEKEVVGKLLVHGAHPQDTSAKKLQELVQLEMEAYDGKLGYIGAVLLTQLGFPAVALGFVLGELGRLVLMDRQHIPSFSRWYHYSLADTIATGEHVVKAYLDNEARNRKKAEKRHARELTKGTE